MAAAFFSPERAFSLSRPLRAMFYSLTPNESSFRSVEEVPDYVDQATPLFITLILLELVIKWAQKGHSSARVNDSIACLSAGVLSRLPEMDGECVRLAERRPGIELPALPPQFRQLAERLALYWSAKRRGGRPFSVACQAYFNSVHANSNSVFSRSVELTTYIYTWERYRLLELPWNSPWTWYLTFLGVDFGYYWFHRMAHEINLLWAGHQAHHSSEDYNLFTALRQSVLQKYTSWIFYLPMALFIPPSVYAVHLQFNLLYQFWIHTEVINNLGPLEFFLNTPSHHRVHHGRNPYCIDKNYGGTLIIWDRIFGTFGAEKDKVIYGLTHPINTFELFKIQFHHLAYMWKTFGTTPGFRNKLSIIFKGPGWGPGKPRLGLPEDIPEVTGKEVPFSTNLPTHLCIYAVIHFVVMLGFYIDLFASQSTLSQVTVLLRVGYIILTLTSIGLLMDQRPEAAFLESARCSAFLLLHKLGYLKTYIAFLSTAYEVLFSLCIAFWSIQMMKQLTTSKVKHR